MPLTPKQYLSGSYRAEFVFQGFIDRFVPRAGESIGRNLVQDFRSCAANEVSCAAHRADRQFFCIPVCLGAVFSEAKLATDRRTESKSASPTGGTIGPSLRAVTPLIVWSSNPTVASVAYFAR